MLDITTIKLIIWDLDDTFWKGTLSEGGAQAIEENIQLVKDATDAGIINSICSKNESDPTVQYLEQLDVMDYFVFASINWESKGFRIKQMIGQMALRPQNVLFLDDNVHNLNEAKHILPELQIAEPVAIQELIAQVAKLPKKDIAHKRLNQYKVLETKAQEAQAYDSNEAFLYASNIRVEMHHDCLQQTERLHDLILRSNQLNFTKKRITKEELVTLLNDSRYQCGYVSVVDNYGDYGIVGFYALRDNTLEHFVFSCRTMGQMIEQWVYAQLGFPHLDVIGEVRTQLNKTDCPQWINQSNCQAADKQLKTTASSCNILLKGPCDLAHSQSYLRQVGRITTEFTYVDDTGKIIEGYNHSVHIIGLHEYSDDDKKLIAKECQFVDAAMLEGTFFTGNYDIIFLSSLIETPYGIYQRKRTNIKVAFGGKHNPLTSPSNWEDYISEKLYNGRNHFTEQYLQEFSANYEFVGSTTPEDYSNFLQKALEWLPKKTTLCIILGTTYPHNGQKEWAEEHRQLNQVVISLAETNPRLRYIALDDIITGDHDFMDNSLNHYTAKVYFEIAQKMGAIIQECTGISVRGYSKNILWFDRVLNKGKSIFTKLFSTESAMYKLLKPIYLRIARKKKTI